MYVAARLTATAVCCLWLSAAATAIRVDDKQHFRLCNVPQVAQLERVEVPECSRWPCLVRAGKTGTYRITFTQHTGQNIRSLKSDIYAWVKLTFDGRDEKPIRVPMPGEKRQPVCGHASPTCPVKPGVSTTVTKTVTIPPQARAAQGQVVVELQVTDERNRVLVCFKAPVIVT